MINTLQAFFQMGGHGFYVFSAYLLVIILLGIQWWLPWHRLRNYLRHYHHE